MQDIKDKMPAEDGFYMPAEFEPQKQIWMLWPERPDVWRDGARPAQKAFTAVVEAISRFELVTVGVSKEQYENARRQLPKEIRVVEISSDDAWMRDVGPTFLVNESGEVRAVHWGFNAWGGITDGLYYPWDQDQLVGKKVCEIERIPCYDATDFVLENGSIHSDGEGTLLTTKMCLLSAGRNPGLDQGQIENKLKACLGVKKVLWLTNGMDPNETNGHVDDVACFVRPGEAACIWTEDETNPFYPVAREVYEELSLMTDAMGRRIKVHKICLPKKVITLGEEVQIETKEHTLERKEGDVCIASYLNFLIVNGGVIVPQYGDENDQLALKQISEIFPEREVVGVYTREIVYGGGNIHCITLQQPRGIKRRMDDEENN